MDKRPNCKSERINIVPGYQDTFNKKIHYCMKCEKEFDYKGRELPPIWAEKGEYECHR